MSDNRVDINYMRAEVSRAALEGAKVVSFKVSEAHHLLARIAELERQKEMQPKGGPVLLGYGNPETMLDMHKGGTTAVRVSRRKTPTFTQAVYRYRIPEVK